MTGADWEAALSAPFAAQQAAAAARQDAKVVKTGLPTVADAQHSLESAASGVVAGILSGRRLLGAGGQVPPHHPLAA